MVDNDDEYKQELPPDEYQFSDLDLIDADQGSTPEEKIVPPLSEEPIAGRHVRRNIFITLGIIILLMLGYKFLAPYFTNSPATDSKIAVNNPPVLPQQPLETTVTPVTPSPPPIQTAPPVSVPVAPDLNEINQKLSALTLVQQNLSEQVTALSNQVNGMNTNFSDLSSKLSSLNTAIENLASKIDTQTEQLVLLRPKKVVRPIVKVRKKGVVAARYYIQAIIPGRAWLVATNGATITVREGTVLPGYGIIKLIDSTQGRVLTSSGQIIKFSQQDS